MIRNRKQLQNTPCWNPNDTPHEKRYRQLLPNAKYDFKRQEVNNNRTESNCKCKHNTTNKYLSNKLRFFCCKALLFVRYLSRHSAASYYNSVRMFGRAPEAQDATPHKQGLTPITFRVRDSLGSLSLNPRHLVAAPPRRLGPAILWHQSLSRLSFSPIKASITIGSRSTSQESPECRPRPPYQC